jgi:RNA polymerase sigma-70 factor (ECF subfamily)
LRVAVNCAKSCKTSAYVCHCVPLAEAREQGVSDNTFDKAIFQFVMQLPPKYSVAIYLFYYEDLKISEISKILNVTQSTVKSRLARGRKQLREIIEREQSYD